MKSRLKFHLLLFLLAFIAVLVIRRGSGFDASSAAEDGKRRSLARPSVEASPVAGDARRHLSRMD